MKDILSNPRTGSLTKRLTMLLVATGAWLSLYLFPTSARAAFGSLYVADSGGSIFIYSPSATRTAYGPAYNHPFGMAYDRSGNLFIANSAGHDIGEVFANGGFSTTFTSGLSQPIGLAFDPAGSLYVSDYTANAIYKFTPAGTRTTFATGLNGPAGIAFDEGGNLFVADLLSNSVFKYSPSGARTTFATGFTNPKEIAVDRSGNVFVGDLSNVIYQCPGNGSARTVFASGFTNLASLAFDRNGSLYVGDIGAHSITILTSYGTRSTFATGVNAEGLLFEPPTGRPLNVSTRVNVLTGDNVPIAGVIVKGSGQKKLLIRAIGPSLAQAGVPGALQDPTLEIRGSTGQLVGTNDNWKQSSQQTEIQQSGVAPTDEREAAIIVSTSAGSFTAIMRGANNSTGVGLIEVYDLTASAPAEVVNLSTRGYVESGNDVMIGGFIIGGGNGSARVVVRALGPSLTAAGVQGALADPVLSVRNVNGDQVAANDDCTVPTLNELVVTGLQPSQSKESATVVTLPNGNYTAIVSGYQNTAGVGLVEVYNLR